MVIRRIFAWLSRPLAREAAEEREPGKTRVGVAAVDDNIVLSEAVGDDGGGGISAGRSSARSGAGLGFRPRFLNQRRT